MNLPFQNSLPQSVHELYQFGLMQAFACVFGASMLAIMLVTRDQTIVSGINRDDFLFLFAIGLQLLLIAFRLEHLREVSVILIFHVLATLMEWFKTSPEIGSWQYPNEGAIFRVYQVPLFAGFLYSSVGSYIARAWRLFDFRFDNFPPLWATLSLAMFAYINFFTHHYIVDFRWVLIAASFLLFRRCWVHYRIGLHYRKIPLLIGLIAVTLFIWIAENLGTYARAWVYPNQEGGWELVHFSKVSAWYLLMLLSFALVALVQKVKKPCSTYVYCISD